jgi:hypothetical protein
MFDLLMSHLQGALDIARGLEQMQMPSGLFISKFAAGVPT